MIRSLGPICIRAKEFPCVGSLKGLRTGSSNTAVLHRGLGRETTVEEDSLEERTEHHLYGVLHTGLFIRDFIEKEKIMGRWSATFTEYSSSPDLEALRDSLRAVIETVKDRATRLGT
jgi:hypothetical protein